MINQYRTLMDQVRTASNPNLMLQQMAERNPQIKDTMQVVSSLYKGNGKEAFYASARQKGMSDADIEAFLNALK